MSVRKSSSLCKFGKNYQYHALRCTSWPALSPRLLPCDHHTDKHQHVSCRSIFYSIKKGIDRHFLAKLQQPIDLRPETISRWIARKKLEEIRYQQRYQEERHKQLGPDLATAHFIIHRGGKAKFAGDDKWHQLENGKIMLPNVRLPNLSLEAVDASSTLLCYEGLDNFVNLKNLKYLDISNCLMIDDWCINKLEILQNSLVYLNISGCSQVTAKGLSTLHHLEHLRRLIMKDMRGVQNMALLTVLVEEMLPNCYVDGVHFSDTDTLIESVDNEFSRTENAEDKKELQS